MDNPNKALLDFIASHESSGNYNAYFRNSGNQDISLTDMTIGEVQNFQRELASKTGSSAAGRYQFLEKTLSGLLPEVGLTAQDKFSPDNQDRMAEALLRRRGLDKFQSGRMTAAEFGNSLAQEWAALPMLSGPKAGRSYYDGDGLNASRVSGQEFLNVLTGSPSHAMAETLYSNSDSDNYQVSAPGSAINISDIQPVRPPTSAEERAYKQRLDDAEAERRANSQGLLSGVGDAVSTQWSGAQWIQDHFQSAPDLAPNPQFRMTSDFMDELTKDIPEQYWDRFSGLSSEGQGRFVRQRVLDNMAAEERLNAMGGTGLALRLAAGFTDPVAWASAAGISAATGGVGAPAALAARFGRLGTAALGAAEGAAGSAVSEGLMYQSNPTYTSNDAIMGIGTGLVLGGAFGAIAHKPVLRDEADAMERFGRQLIAGGGMDSSAGAASVGVRQHLRNDISDIITHGKALAPSPAFGMLRFDLAATFKKSKNTLTRMLGNFMVEDGTRNADGFTPFSVSESRSLISDQYGIAWRKASEPQWLAYGKRTGDLSDDARRSFMEKVTDYVSNRAPSAGDEADAEVKAVGEAMRSLYARWVDDLANPGKGLDGSDMRPVRGFMGRTADNYYTPRIFDLGKVNHMLNRYGDFALADMVGKAIQKLTPSLSDEAATRFGASYIRTISGMTAGELSNGHRAFSGEDLDGLKKFLMDDVADIDPKTVDHIIESLTPKEDKGAVSRGKHKALFDDGFGGYLKPNDGGPAEYVRIADLMVRDADQLMNIYTHQMSGRLALARLRIRNPKWQDGDLMDQFFVDGITSDGEVDTLLKKIRAVGQAEGQRKVDIDADVDRMQNTINMILGRPAFGESNDKLNAALRMARDTNFMRLMGGAGFAQVPEFANIPAQVGMKAMMENMPSLRSFIREAQTGKLADALAEEIENTTAQGAEWYRHSFHGRADDLDNPMSPFESGGTVDKLDQWQQGAKQFVNVYSGMAPVNTVLQRTASRAIFQEFAREAKLGTWKASKRIKGLGLDQKMLDRISGQIQKHSRFGTSRIGTPKLEQMNFKAWDDVGARSAFEAATYRMSRTVIQANDIGNLSLWMNRSWARTLLQFRGFMLAGWSKQFLAGLNQRDWKTFASFTASWFLAAMTYAARTYLNSAGRGDREEYLQKQLAPSQIALNGLQNSSWFTLLGPAIETPYSWATNESLFSGRNTGLDSDAVFGNPTMDLARRVSKLPATAGHALSGRGVTEADARSALGILPFSNMMGITNIGAAMISGLPDRREK